MNRNNINPLNPIVDPGNGDLDGDDNDNVKHKVIIKKKSFSEYIDLKVFEKLDIQDKITTLINYLLPSKSCTRANLLVSLFALAANKPYLSSVCYSNSLAILVSFQSASVWAPESYANLVKVYKSSAKFWVLNIISHYLPVIIFYKLIKTKDVTLTSVTNSCFLHLLWGKSVNWDINKIYDINPPLDKVQRLKIWVTAVLTHYLIYFVPRKIYPVVLPMVLPIGKHSMVKALLKLRPRL